MKLGPSHIGKTMLLSDGTEDTIIGYEDMTEEYHSDTRWWTKDGKEIDGQTDKDVLSVKDVLAWRVQFGGYGPTSGPYESRRILLSDQHLACTVAASYNDRTRAYQPDGSGSFVRAEVSAVILQASPHLVFENELAQDVLNTDEIYDSWWQTRQRIKQIHADSAGPAT